MYPDILPGLLKRLKSLEQMKSWEAVLGDKAGRKHHPKNHYILVEDIISPAQKRLEELKLNDYDTLYSLTITGERRLWGIITEGTFLYSGLILTTKFVHHIKNTHNFSPPYRFRWGGLFLFFYRSRFNDNIMIFLQFVHFLYNSF